MRLMYRHLYKRIQTNKRNTRHVIPHSPSSCFVKHSKLKMMKRVRSVSRKFGHECKRAVKQLRSRASFFIFQVALSGSFEMLALIPASNEWCRIGSCCLSMFELRLIESCFSKVSAPVDSPLRQVRWQDKFKRSASRRQIGENLSGMVDLLGCCGWQLCKPIEKMPLYSSLHNPQPEWYSGMSKHLHEWRSISLHRCPNIRIPMLTGRVFVGSEVPSAKIIQL